jgi:hypothetical protein
MPQSRESQKAMFARKYHKINSFVDAEKYKVEIDGFVGTVIEGQGTKAKIVGYSQGQTFTRTSVGKIHPQLKAFETSHNDAPEEVLEIFALNPVIARKIAEGNWINNDFSLVQVTSKRMEV